MIRLRRLLPVLAVPVLLAGCGDVVDGTGAPASGSRSADFPSGSASVPDPSGTGGPTSSEPSPSSSSPSSSTGGGTSLTSLRGYATTVRFDPAFLTALTALKVTPGLVGTARLSGSSVALPVTGGAISTTGSGSTQSASGSADHDGSGLTLTAGAMKVSLTALRFEFGATSQVSGLVVATTPGAPTGRVTLLELDTDSARIFGSTRVVTIGGLSVKLDTGLAGLLNKAFGTTGFSGSTVVGTAISTLIGSN